MSQFDLSAFSNAVADIVEVAGPGMASLRTRHHRTASAFHWRDGFFVAAEEAVDTDDEVELVLASGEAVKAELVGRDPSTGIALLKPAGGAKAPELTKAGDARVGNLAIVVGGSEGSPIAVTGTIGEVGPAWRSMRGGQIDRRINLAVMAGGRFEGAAVLDAGGGLVGMMLFGPRRRALVIPRDTIERAVATLREKGHVSSGYLGAGLHPIRNGEMRGAMVMSLDDEGPAKAAGLHLGDIIVSWNGEAVHGPRELIRKLGPDSAGAVARLGIVRGGETREVDVTIGSRPLG